MLSRSSGDEGEEEGDEEEESGEEESGDEDDDDDDDDDEGEPLIHNLIRCSIDVSNCPLYVEMSLIVFE